MPKGQCVLFLSTIGAFYSKLYNLKEHPNYHNLYESWIGNKEKLYDHKKELETKENSNYALLCDCGLQFAKPLDNLKIETVDKHEIQRLSKGRYNEIRRFKN